MRIVKFVILSLFSSFFCFTNAQVTFFSSENTKTGIYDNVSIYGEAVNNEAIVQNTPNNITFHGEKWSNSDEAYINKIALASEDNPQSIGGGEFGSVRINSDQGMSLTDKPLTVSQNLIFENGKLILNNQILTLTESAQILGYSEDRFIVTNEEGFIRKLALDSTYIFPIGKNENEYSPAEITNYGEIDDFQVRVLSNIDSLAPFTDFSYTNNTIWEIKESTFGDSEVDLKLQHNSTLEGENFSNNDSYIARFVNEYPNYHGGALSNLYWDYTGKCQMPLFSNQLTTDDGNVLASLLERKEIIDLHNYTYFTKVSCHAEISPFDLLNFSAQVVEDIYIQLNWSTENDGTIAGYELQRSLDNISFETLKWIDSNVSNNYSYNDYEVAIDELYFYRLKRVSNEAIEQFSNVVTAKILQGEKAEATIFPNPTNRTGNILLYADTEMYTKITFFNQYGKSVKIINQQLMPGENLIPVDFLNFQSSVYTVAIEKNGENPIIRKWIISQ